MKKQKWSPETIQDLNAAEMRLFKKEEKKIKAIKSIAGVKHYIHNANAMKKGRTRIIVMLAVQNTRLIKAKLAMPVAELAYLRHSEDMRAAQFDNTSGFFTVPFDLLATWETQNTALSNAITDITNGVVEGDGDKITAMNDLKVTLILALAYINRKCLLNQRQAVAIIEAALMEVVGRGTINIQEIAVKLGSASGQIIVRSMWPMEDAKKLKTTFFWNKSIDNGATWIEMDPSHKAIIIATGLTANVSVKFRKRTWTKNGYSEWVVSKAIMPF